MRMRKVSIEVTYYPESLRQGGVGPIATIENVLEALPWVRSAVADSSTDRDAGETRPIQDRPQS